MKYIGVIILILAGIMQGKAQTDINLSHLYIGRINYNPSAAGVDPETINLNAYFREQWIGFDRAPSTQVINIDNYFNKYRSGAGLVLINDEIGFSKSFNLKASYAYHIKLNADSYLSLGLALGIIHNSSDERNFNAEDPDDPEITYMIEKETLADFDVGAEYHWKNLCAGFSAAHITKGKDDANVTPHYYAYVNYAMNVNEDWQVAPTLFTAINQRSRLYEVCTIVEYRHKINAGVAYRMSEKFSSDAIVGLLGIVVSDYVRVGYSYDFTTGVARNDVTGAHELVMSFRINKSSVWWKK